MLKYETVSLSSMNKVVYWNATWYKNNLVQHLTFITGTKRGVHPNPDSQQPPCSPEHCQVQLQGRDVFIDLKWYW